jgi:hypothetical protein
MYYLDTSVLAAYYWLDISAKHFGIDVVNVLIA